MLDVPFVPQSEALCGGAAAAMVLRYWGRRDVFAEDFAPLVDASGGGIEAARLAEALRQRGFVVHVAAGDPSSAARHLARGRPPILLLELAAGRRHFVVAVAWSESHVLVHDPAERPFRVWSRSELEKAWSRTGRLMLIVLPSSSAADTGAGAGPRSDAARDGTDAERHAPDPEDCGGLVPDAVARAKEDDLEEAALRLEAAARLCPRACSPLRELAGVRFRQQRYSEAASRAAQALAVAPADALSWRLLATSRYMLEDEEAALRAWNRLGEPLVDLVSVEGLDRTRPAVVSSRLGIAPRSALTASDWRRATRRLAEVPSLAASRLRVRSVGGGRVELVASVVERPLLQPLLPLLAEVAADAATRRETRLALTSVGGEGGRLAAGVRWWRRRPAAWISLEAPRALGLPGIVGLEAAYDEQHYAPRGAAGSATVRERYRRATLAVGDWSSADLHARLSLSLERLEGAATRGVLGAGFERRLAGDRVALLAEGGGGLPLDGGRGFASGGARVAVRSTAAPRATVVLRARAGVSSVSSHAPLARWPGAGSGTGRDLLLRAHPLLSDGVVAGEAFGRRLLDAGLELDARITKGGFLRLAGFVDLARPFERLGAAGSGPWLADAGAGLRVRLPAVGTLRLDLATRVTTADASRSGGVTFSGGWQPAWPR